jgi:hypothetical protein
MPELVWAVLCKVGQETSWKVESFQRIGAPEALVDV